MTTLRGIVRGFDRDTHTATVELAGAPAAYLAGVPVSHALPWWTMIEGAQCGVVFFDETDAQDACLAFVYGGAPPADPHFDPEDGHRHTGADDDGPVLA
jgi:hypothetical protein